MKYFDFSNRPRNYVDTEISIADYGKREGWTMHGPRPFTCGERPFAPFIWVPRFPTLKHSICQLLQAIQTAAAWKQDLPTRTDVRAMAATMGLRRRIADHPNYWRDLFRFGYVKQYRRKYGKGSRRHFDVVYELTFRATDLLEAARQNMAANLPPIESIDPGFDTKTVPWAKQRGQWKCPFAMVPPLSNFKD